jgi:hypothetical protein
VSPDTRGVPLAPRLDREAGIITLLLGERPTLAFTSASRREQRRLPFGVPLLVSHVEALEISEAASGVSSHQAEETAAGIVEGLGLFGLETT